MPQLVTERAQHERTRARLAHGISGRGAGAQAIEHQIADRRPVARAGEAVRDPPILQGLRRRALARLDIGEDLDRRARPRRWGHQAGLNSRMRAMTITHISSSAMRADAEYAGAAVEPVRGHMDISVDDPRQHEHPGIAHRGRRRASR